jgi:hypothetical protein
MWIIMWSLTAVLFDHGRHSGARAGMPPIAVLSPLTLTVERARDLPADLVEHALEEAAAIWCPLGVSFTWHFVAPDEPTHASNEVRVIFTDAINDGASEVPLGWIRFITPSTPEPIVHLSLEAARRLLTSTPALRDKPLQWKNMLMGRVLGRAFAHELGHYVLASKNHTAHGLMRAHLSLEALTDVERVGFDLTMT